MARTSRPKAAPSAEAFGERLARLRKDRGLTQVQLAAQAEMLQGVISDYENGKLRPYADVVARFAEILDVSADELLGLKARRGASKPAQPDPSRRFLRRAQLIQQLPKRDQDALARTIDNFLKLHLDDRSA